MLQMRRQVMKKIDSCVEPPLKKQRLADDEVNEMSDEEYSSLQQNSKSEENSQSEQNAHSAQSPKTPSHNPTLKNCWRCSFES